MNALVQDLKRMAGDSCASENPTDREAYAHDFWPRQLIATRGRLARPTGPSAIFWPTKQEHIVSVLEYAKRMGVRVTPFGAGSGVTGGLTLEPGVIAVDMKRMRTVHSVDLERGVADVDAGILGEHLEEHLARKGATLGHFPSSISCSTLGGWLATRSAGQCSGRYGKIEDMAVSLQGVLPTGETYNCGPAHKGELDARSLIVGSESLFGFITRATMRVWPAPVSRKVMSFSFATMEEGWNALRALYQAGLRPAVTRLYDPFDTYIFKSGKRKTHSSSATPRERGGFVDALAQRLLSRPGWINSLNNRLGQMVFGRCLLIVIYEVAGDEPADHLTQATNDIALAHAGRDEGAEWGERWLVRRHSVSYRLPPTFARGLWADTFEVSAPWSNLRDTYEQVRDALGHAGFVMAHMSHAYPDGCSIYFTFAGGSTNDAQALDRYTETWSRALVAAHRGGGSISHHHGIGRSKRAGMRLELGAGVDVIASLARAADPHGVMQRGPLLPEQNERVAVVAPGAGVTLDTLSRLVTADGETRLGSLRAILSRANLALPEASHLGDEVTVRTWLASCGDAPLASDPVDHRVAGFSAQWKGRLVRVVPAPRRAAGPDLFTLFQHGAERFGALRTVTLRVRGNEERVAWSPNIQFASTDLDPTLRSWIDRFATSSTH